MYSNRLILLAFVLCGLYLAPPAAFAQPTPKPQRLDVTVKDADASLENEWFGVYFQNKKIGYYNSSRVKVTEKGVSFYREKMAMVMKLTSLEMKSEMKIEQKSDFAATPPFRLLHLDYRHIDDNITQHIKLVAKGDKAYDVTITTAGVVEKKTIELDYTMADSLSSDVWLKAGPKKGDSITTTDFDPDTLKTELVTTKLISKKQALEAGVKMTLHEIESFSHKNKTTSVSIYDDKAHMLSGTIAGVFKVRRESEKDAKNTEFSADLFLLGVATIDVPIGETRKVTSLVMEVKGKEMAHLPSGPHQTMVHKGDDVYVLKIGKEFGKKVKATSEEIKEALEETTAYPINNDKVKALAAKAIGDAKTDKEKVIKLCKFVHDFIQPKYEGSLPKIHDLIERKCGDCKSYALLFTTLARAAGLPSREVSGFVYMGDDLKAFGGHAWNEALIGGHWVPIDASMNSTDLDAAHICLGTDRESTNAMLQTFGKLQFKLIDVKTAK